MDKRIRIVVAVVVLASVGFWWMRRDGSQFPVQLLSDVVTDEAGEPIAVVTTCEDISQRQRLEERLRGKSLDLEYPCAWEYTFIATDQETAELEVSKLAGNRLQSMTVSRQSKSGTYTSLKALITVQNDSERQELFDQIVRAEGVKYVL